MVQLCCAVSHAPLLTLLLLLCLCLSSLLIQFTPYGQMISPLLSVSPKSWCPSTFPTLFPTMSLHVKLNFSTRRHGFSLPRLATFFLDLNLPAFRNVLIHPLHKCKFYHPFKRLFSKASGFSPPLEFHITSSVALGASLSPELSPFMI